MGVLLNREKGREESALTAVLGLRRSKNELLLALLATAAGKKWVCYFQLQHNSVVYPQLYCVVDCLPV